LSIATLFPTIATLVALNPIGPFTMDLLQANNLAANSNSTEDCGYLKNAVDSWLKSVANTQTSFIFESAHDDMFVIWAQLLPIRCDWQEGTQGVITSCIGGNFTSDPTAEICTVWDDMAPDGPQ